jgi:hypothetical protein
VPGLTREAKGFPSHGLNRIVLPHAQVEELNHILAQMMPITALYHWLMQIFVPKLLYMLLCFGLGFNIFTAALVFGISF